MCLCFQGRRVVGLWECGDVKRVWCVLMCSCYATYVCVWVLRWDSRRHMHLIKTSIAFAFALFFRVLLYFVLFNYIALPPKKWVKFLLERNSGGGEERRSGEWAGRSAPEGGSVWQVYCCCVHLSNKMIWRRHNFDITSLRSQPTHVYSILLLVLTLLHCLFIHSFTDVSGYPYYSHGFSKVKV